MNSCGEVRTALGIYVVGAIEPAERSRLEAHLAGCPVCRDELAAMAGLPALLARVSEEQLAHVAGPPEELLDSLLAKAAAERPPSASRFGRRLWAPLAAAAAIILVAGFLLGGLLMGGGGTHGARSAAPPSARPSASVPVPLPVPLPVPPAVIAEQAAATDPKTHVNARVAFKAEDWGTALTIQIDGAQSGTKCYLVVNGRDGRRDIAASWQVEAEGYGDYNGSTMIPRADVASFQIVTVKGETLVTVPVRA